MVKLIHDIWGCRGKHRLQRALNDDDDDSSDVCYMSDTTFNPFSSATLLRFHSNPVGAVLLLASFHWREREVQIRNSFKFMQFYVVEPEFKPRVDKPQTLCSHQFTRPRLSGSFHSISSFWKNTGEIRVNKNGSALAEIIEKVENTLPFLCSLTKTWWKIGRECGEAQWETPEQEWKPIRGTLRPSRGAKMTCCAYPKKAWADVCCTFSNGSSLP